MTYTKYIIGFSLSLLCTIGAYMLIQDHISSQHTVFSHPFLLFSILILALVQICGQLFFFLHLGTEKDSWKLGILLFALLVIAILVGGSIWIMANLNYRMMPSPMQVQQYMNDQSGI